MEYEKFCWLAEAGRLRHAVAAANSLWQRFASVNCVQPRHGEILREALCKMPYSPLSGNQELSDGVNAHLKRAFSAANGVTPLSNQGLARWQLPHKRLCSI